MSDDKEKNFSNTKGYSLQKANQLDRDNSFLAAATTGMIFTVPITLAVTILFVNVSSLPLYLAYFILATVVIIGIAFISVWAHRKKLARKIFGVKVTDITDLTDDMVTDYRENKLLDNISLHVKTLTAYYSAITLRRSTFTLVALLLGEFVLLIQVAMLIQQTTAIKAQTDVSKLQLQALQTQNTLLEKRDKIELLWAIHYDQPAEQLEAFTQLTRLGVREFYGLELNRGLFNGVALQGKVFRRNVFSYFEFVNAILTDSIFEQGEINQSNFTKSIFRDGEFDRVNISYTKFNDADLTSTDFIGCTLNNVSFKNTILDNADFKDTPITAEQLKDAKSFRNITGVDNEVLTTLRKISPEKMKWWDSNEK